MLSNVNHELTRNYELLVTGLFHQLPLQDLDSIFFYFPLIVISLYISISIGFTLKKMMEESFMVTACKCFHPYNCTWFV